MKFFPRKDAFSGSRRRAHPGADALGHTLTHHWEDLARNDSEYNQYFPNEWVISTRLNPDTEADYTSWEEYFSSPYTYNGDTFTNTEGYDLANTTFTEEAASIHIDNVHGSRVTPYDSNDIIILSDGLCSSACALFMELMRHEAHVKTIVVGGRPDYTPMQAPSGTRGAANYQLQQMDDDIEAALSINNATAAYLPTDRQSGLFITEASVNLRDQILQEDISRTPLQFQFEKADCRIFYTPHTWYNFTNLWHYAAKAAWENSTLCIEKPSPSSTQPSVSNMIHEAKQTDKIFASPEKLENTAESPSSTHLDDPFNDILDSSRRNPENLEGNPCKKSCECGHRLDCIKVPVCQEFHSKPTMRSQCIAPCGQISRTTFKDCPYGFYCRIDDPASKSSKKIDRPWRLNPGHCYPVIPPKCSSLGQLSIDSTDSNGEDTNGAPCLRDLGDADELHCFPARQPCFKKCFVVRWKEFLDYPVLEKKIRWCTNSQLKSWENDWALEPFQLDDGSQQYEKYDTDQECRKTGPSFLVYHADSEHNFKNSFKIW